MLNKGTGEHVHSVPVRTAGKIKGMRIEINECFRLIRKAANRVRKFFWGFAAPLILHITFQKWAAIHSRSLTVGAYDRGV